MLMAIGMSKALRFAMVAAPAAIICQAPTTAENGLENICEDPRERAMMLHLEGSANLCIEGDRYEELCPNFPLVQGDSIMSSGQAVVQLGSGAMIALENVEEFEIESIYAPPPDEGSQVSSYLLEGGRIRIAAGQEQSENIIIKTPEVEEILLSEGSNASIERNKQMVVLKVFEGNLEFISDGSYSSMGAGEKVTVYSGNRQVERGNFNKGQRDHFEIWADQRMAPSRQISMSVSNGYVDENIAPLARPLDDYGKWVRAPAEGGAGGPSMVWVPNKAAPDWRPYTQGHWSPAPNGMTWVSHEPFGYVTHHYGRWGWSSQFGWYWIPGVYYSPAWVAWNMDGDLFGWAPLGYYNRPVYYGHQSRQHDLWNVVNVSAVHDRQISRHLVWSSDIARRFPTYRASSPEVPKWRGGPLIVTRSEFQNPNRSHFNNAMSPKVASERIRAYEQKAQRQLIRRQQPSGPAANSVRLAKADRPFEDAATRSTDLNEHRKQSAPRLSSGGGARVRLQATQRPQQPPQATPAQLLRGDTGNSGNINGGRLQPTRPGASERSPSSGRAAENRGEAKKKPTRAELREAEKKKFEAAKAERDAARAKGGTASNSGSSSSSSSGSSPSEPKTKAQTLKDAKKK